jgi:acetolactate decarboxylase
MRCFNKIGRLFLAFWLLLALAIPAVSGPARDVLFQISTIDSLMVGLYDGWMSIGELRKHGDFGLGTFDMLDGEMVVMDGTVYQITSDGVAHKPASTVSTPFAAVTFFDRDITSTIPGEMDLSSLKDYLDGLLPSKNLFYAIRIDGIFPRVKTRSVPMQSKPYPKLLDVTARQPVFDLTDVKGSIVALRCPYFVNGANVPGYHMHFLTADRKRGGHLLDCAIKTGMTYVDTTTDFVLSLPNDERFYRADLSAQSQKNLEKVEQGKR